MYSKFERNFSEKGWIIRKNRNFTKKEKDELDKTYLKEIFKLIEEERRNKSGEKRVARKVWKVKKRT